MTTPQSTTPFYTKPGFIASCLGAILLLFAPVFTFGPVGFSGIDLISEVGFKLFPLLIIISAFGFLFVAFLIADGGKNPKLAEQFPAEKREKMMKLPIGLMASVIGSGLMDVGGDIFKLLGIVGFWIPFVLAIFVGFEQKIMEKIKK